MNKEVLELINRRENQLLLHCALYYKFGKNIISDNLYDKWSFELKDLIDEYPKEFSLSNNKDNFNKFDPSSGYYLNYTNYIDRAANVYNYYCKVNKINDGIKMESVSDHIDRIKKR